MLVLLLLSAFLKTEFEGLIIIIFQCKLIISTLVYEYLSIFIRKAFPEEKKILTFSKIDLKHALVEIGMVFGLLASFLPFMLNCEESEVVISNLFCVCIIVLYLGYFWANSGNMKVSTSVKILERTW